MNKNIYVLFIDIFWVCFYLYVIISVILFVRLLNFIIYNFVFFWWKNKKVIDDCLFKGVVLYVFGEIVC